MSAIKSIPKYKYLGEDVYVMVERIVPSNDALPKNNSILEIIKNSIYSRAVEHSESKEEYTSFVDKMMNIPWNVYCYDRQDSGIYAVPTGEFLTSAHIIEE